MRFFLLCLLSISASFSICVNAEIYRWVDDQGEVHYSDKKPEAEIAKEVSNSLGPINRDSSSSETKKLQQLFRGETPEEKQFRLQQEKDKRQQAARLNEACDKARLNLKKLKGRFHLVDESGISRSVSKDEQKELIRSQEKEINKHC